MSSYNTDSNPITRAQQTEEEKQALTRADHFKLHTAIATPGTKPTLTRSKKSIAIPGDKSFFSTTPFLNRFGSMSYSNEIVSDNDDEDIVRHAGSTFIAADTADRNSSNGNLKPEVVPQPKINIDRPSMARLHDVHVSTVPTRSKDIKRQRLLPKIRDANTNISGDEDLSSLRKRIRTLSGREGGFMSNYRSRANNGNEMFSQLSPRKKKKNHESS